MNRACAGLALAAWLGAVGARAAPCSSAVGYRVMTIGDRPVAVWYPSEAQPERLAYSARFSGMVARDAPPTHACGAVPLVVFSHGYLGCALQSVALTEELARHGYVVAAPDHADAALCHITKHGARVPAPAQPSILKPDAWTEATRADRRADLAAVIDRLLADWRDLIDAQRIGLMGHSLGGYTVVGMAGGWPAWRDARIRAVVALSPYVMPFQVGHTLEGVEVPLMYQGGSGDVGITPFLLGPHGAYAQAHAPAYLLVLRAAGHFAWVNCGRESSTVDCLAHVDNARLSARYAIAFFDRYLKDRPTRELEQGDPKLARFDHK